jgi:hypothetical protein
MTTDGPELISACLWAMSLGAFVITHIPTSLFLIAVCYITEVKHHQIGEEINLQDAPSKQSLAFWHLSSSSIDEANRKPNENNTRKSFHQHPFLMSQLLDPCYCFKSWNLRWQPTSEALLLNKSSSYFYHMAHIS